MTTKITCIPARSDNYVWILETGNSECIVVDPSEAQPVLTYLETSDLKPRSILITHHHSDHVAGIDSLVAAYDCDVYGPAMETSRVPQINQLIDDGQEFQIGTLHFQAIHTPGHTSGHFCYYIPDEHILLAGDTLFSMGCGRLFEESPAIMFQSLSKIKVLPPDTLVCCAHEYTEKNARFAAQFSQDEATRLRIEEVSALRAEGKPSLPVRLETELATNPFLRTTDPDYRAQLPVQSADALEAFTFLRKERDSF